jgi:hypothetical protein
VAFFHCYMPERRPATAALPILAAIAGRPVACGLWPMEEDFQVGKDDFVPDHSQVRSYIVWLWACIDAGALDTALGG